MIAAADAAGRDRVRLVLDRRRGGRRRQLEGIRAAERRTLGAAAHRDDGPRQRHGLRGAGRGRRVRHRRRGDRSRGGRAGARARQPGRHRAWRLPGRAPRLRGRRPRRHARLPRLLGARGPGGPLVLGGRQAGRLAARHDRRRRPRPGRACRRASTPRASRSSACCSSTTAVCRDLAFDSQTAAAPGAAPPATGCPPRTRRPVPDQHVDGAPATRRSTSWSPASTGACS